MFVNRFTGEVFDDYDDYVEKMKFYLARQWSCKYTGQSGLTFEEALQSEAKAGLFCRQRELLTLLRAAKRSANR